jgi:hypothetical protein
VLRIAELAFGGDDQSIYVRLSSQDLFFFHPHIQIAESRLLPKSLGGWETVPTLTNGAIVIDSSSLDLGNSADLEWLPLLLTFP